MAENMHPAPTSQGDTNAMTKQRSVEGGERAAFDREKFVFSYCLAKETSKATRL